MIRFFSIILFAILGLSITSCRNKACNESNKSSQETGMSSNGEIFRLQSDLQSWGIAIPDSQLMVTDANRDLWDCMTVLDEIVTKFDSTGAARHERLMQAYEMFFVEQRQINDETLHDIFRQKTDTAISLQQ